MKQRLIYAIAVIIWNHYIAKNLRTPFASLGQLYQSLYTQYSKYGLDDLKWLLKETKGTWEVST